jgi:hypothetical protein
MKIEMGKLFQFLALLNLFCFYKNLLFFHSLYFSKKVINNSRTNFFTERNIFGKIFCFIIHNWILQNSKFSVFIDKIGHEKTDIFKQKQSFRLIF